MKFNSLDGKANGFRQNLIPIIITTIGFGIVAVALFNVFIDLSIIVYNFIINYWLYIVLGFILLLFLRRFFKRKELVVKSPELYR